MKIYLTATFPQEPEKTREIRMALAESWPQVNEVFTKEHIYENKIIQYKQSKLYPKYI